MKETPRTIKLKKRGTVPRDKISTLHPRAITRRVAHCVAPRTQERPEGPRKEIHHQAQKQRAKQSNPKGKQGAKGKISPDTAKNAPAHTDPRHTRKVQSPPTKERSRRGKRPERKRLGTHPPTKQTQQTDNPDPPTHPLPQTDWRNKKRQLNGAPHTTGPRITFRAAHPLNASHPTTRCPHARARAARARSPSGQP